MIEIGKFRTFNGRLIIKNELIEAFCLSARVKSLLLEREVLDYYLTCLEKELNTNNDYLISLFFDGCDLISKKQPITGVNKSFALDYSDYRNSIAFENFFWVGRDGRIHSFEDLIHDPLAIYCQKILNEKSPCSEENFCVDFFVEKDYSIEEAFFVSVDRGMVPVKKIGDISVGNSRFFEKYLLSFFK